MKLFWSDKPVVFGEPIDITPESETEHCFEMPHYEMSLDMACEAVAEDYVNDGKIDGYNVTVIDAFGNKTELRDMTMIHRLRVARRIPRKMKKMLKKRYGDMWLIYHPNVETVVELKRK